MKNDVIIWHILNIIAPITIFKAPFQLAWNFTPEKEKCSPNWIISSMNNSSEWLCAQCIFLGFIFPVCTFMQWRGSLVSELEIHGFIWQVHHLVNQELAGWSHSSLDSMSKWRSVMSGIPHRSVMALWQDLCWWHGAVGLSADGTDFSASSATSQKPIPFLTPNDFLLLLHIFLVSLCFLNSEVLPVLEDWADDFYIKQMGFFYRRNYNNFLHLKGYCLWSMHYCKTFLFHKVLIKIILKQDLKSILCDCISGVVDMFTQ